MAGFAWVSALGWTLVAIGGASLILWVVGRSGRRQRRCPRCDYDMSATPGLACSECGRAAGRERRLHRRRRSRAWRRFALVTLLLGGAALVFNPNRADGWAASVPDWALWPLTGVLSSHVDGLIDRAHTTPPAPPAHWERVLLARRCQVEIRKIVDRATPAGQVRHNPLERLERAADMQRSIVDALRAGAELRLVGAGIAELAASYPSPDRDPDREPDRELVLESLHGLAPLTGPALRTVRGMMDDNDVGTWLAAFHVLRRSAIEDDELREIAVPALDHPSWEVRRAAVQWLGQQVPGDESLTSRFEAMRRDDPHEFVRTAAELALRPVGGRPAK